MSINLLDTFSNLLLIKLLVALLKLELIPSPFFMEQLLKFKMFHIYLVALGEYLSITTEMICSIEKCLLKNMQSLYLHFL